MFIPAGIIVAVVKNHNLMRVLDSMFGGDGGNLRTGRVEANVGCFINRQQTLCGPCKPGFACPGVPWGLSGIMALHVPPPVCQPKGSEEIRRGVRDSTTQMGGAEPFETAVVGCHPSSI